MLYLSLPVRGADSFLCVFSMIAAGRQNGNGKTECEKKAECKIEKNAIVPLQFT